ncbi:MAG: glycogen/starch synthase [Bacteroides sp.]|nr:glycogen/starch synthase [Bacteroides sp.]MCM1095442.1 glycogen/starch synthase [Terasakiella sp.]
MDLNKVLYISQEINPYLPSTPLADFSRSLPEGIQGKGTEVRTFMPRYGCINERRNQLHEVIRLSGMNIIIDDTDHPLIIKVATLQPSRMQVYFIDNDDYFLRHAADGLETETLFDENDERSIFFVRGVLETVRKLRWIPSLIHCTGWISALAPLFLKKVYSYDPSFADVKVVYSLFDQTFDGTMNEAMASKILSDEIAAGDIPHLAGAAGLTELQKTAIDYADAICISSPGIPDELIEYARASGKPLLEYTGDEEGFAAAYKEFYLSL